MIGLAYWLLKTEPQEYSYTDLVRAGRDVWDGVRSNAAKKHLAAMQPGDLAFIYHTGTERAIVGIAQILTGAYSDPTDPEGKWLAVDVAPLEELPRPISLAEIKQGPRFAQWDLVRLPRLSVMPVPESIWYHILELARS